METGLGWERDSNDGPANGCGESDASDHGWARGGSLGRAPGRYSYCAVTVVLCLMLRLLFCHL